MSELKELIQALCPNGVEYKPLGEVGTFIRGNGLQKKDFTESGVPCIHYGQIYTHYGTFATKTKSFCSPDLAKRLTKINNGNLIIACTSENIDDVCKAVAWLGDEDIVTGGHACVFKHSENPKYISYFFQTYDFYQQKKKYARGTKVIDIKASDLEKILIPVPPIEVQEEIVKILDAFTEMTASLQAELQAELQARKEQYEYYRNLLLSFNTTYGDADDEQKDKLTITPPSSYRVKWLSMGEICDIRNGYTPSKANPDFWEEGTIPWFRMEDIRQNGRILSDSIQHITPQAVKGGKYFPANSIILATTATIGEHALIIADSLANQRFTNLSIRKSLIDKIDIKYFFHYMFIVDEWCKKNTNVSGFASVDMTKFKKLLVPVPPIEVQEEIVRILDKFEAIVSDLSAGIPAEIAARQEQYEYYRNRLLTFPQL